MSDKNRFLNLSEQSSEERTQAYLVVLILVGDLQCVHGLDHGLHGCEDVLVHQLFEASLVFIRVSTAMDDPHLFNERALATFTSS